MKSLCRSLFTVTVLLGLLHATSLPEEARVHKSLSLEGETAFISEFCEIIASINAEQIAAFHTSLAKGLADKTLPSVHGTTALALSEQRWLELDPKSLLESCAAGRTSLPLAVQAKALHSLLRTDLEAVLNLYLLIPLNENFAQRCDFFSKLAAIDPARAVRFYFESNECERIFDNPLEISFTAWAKRDFNAAWIAANAIEDEDKREASLGFLLGYTTKIGIEKTCDLLIKIPDPDDRALTAERLIYTSDFKVPQVIQIARRLNLPRLWNIIKYPLRDTQPGEAIPILLEALPEDQRVAVLSSYILGKTSYKPTPENTDPLFALIPYEALRSAVRGSILNYSDEDKKLAMAPPQDEQFEALLAGGAIAYKEIQDGDKAVALAKAMFQRFPERSLPWALQLDDHSRNNSLRNLADFWPKEKIPTDTARFLTSKDSGEIEFGIRLGFIWLRADPEKAIKTLFSKHPNHFQTYRGSIPFYQIQNDMKWDAARVGKLLDEIENPEGRAIVYREWLVWRMRDLPYEKRITEIIALDDEESRQRAIGDMVYSAMMKPDATVIDQILKIPAEHSAVRDRILMHYLIKTTEEKRFDTGRAEEMITAIHDEANLLELIETCRPRNSLRAYSQLMCKRLAEVTPGVSRDQYLRAFLREMTSAKLLALAIETESPQLRKFALARLSELTLDDTLIARCEALFAALPAAHRDPQIDNRWFLRKALREPTTHSQEFLQRALADPSFIKHLPEFFAALQKIDASAAHRLVMSMEDEPRFERFYQTHFDAEARRDPQATIDHLLSGSTQAQTRLPNLLRIQLQTAPRAACFNCLRMADPKLRREMLELSVSTWAKADITAATAWAEALPPSLDREFAVYVLYQNRDKEAEIALYRSRMESRSTLSALAEIDFDAVSAKTRAMPAGEAKNLALLGLLDHALQRKKAELIESLSRELLATEDVWLAETTATTLINSLEQTDLEKAIALITEVRPPQARDAVARQIINRWNAAEFRPKLEAWIRAWPDPRSRHTLAAWYLTELLRDEKTNHETLAALRDQTQKISPATRAALASALINRRTADALAAAEDIEDPQLQILVEAWIQAQTP